MGFVVLKLVCYILFVLDDVDDNSPVLKKPSPKSKSNDDTRFEEPSIFTNDGKYTQCLDYSTWLDSHSV